MGRLAFKTDLLLGLYVASLILANLLGTKITTLFGVRVSVGILFMPVLFLVTDIVAEVHGRERARRFVLVSIAILAFLFCMLWLAIILPPNATWGEQEAYERIFGGSLRMVVASLVAFALSQLHDVWSFDFWKRRTHGRFLWLRNNLSTMASQLIDTVVFMFIAFYQVTPKFTAAFIVSLIIPYYCFKILLAAVDTPLCYLGVRWLRAK